MAENMPCGMPLRRRAPDFIIQYPTPISKVACEWLSWVEEEQDIDIQHARNSGEVRIGPKKIAVDGYHA